MNPRVFITKSKAGHYTATARWRQAAGLAIASRSCIENLEQARAAIPALLQELKDQATRHVS
jgi:hypothetical protein